MNHLTIRDTYNYKHFEVIKEGDRICIYDYTLRRMLNNEEIRVEKDPEMEQVFLTLVEDADRTSLLRRIIEGDTQAIIEFLTKYCKDRGYTEGG